MHPNSRYFELCHERVVVTGGGSGIGRGVALALAEAGCTVYVMGRRIEKLEETSALKGEAGRIVPVRCDVREWASVDEAFTVVEQEGPAPALVHAASDITRMLFEQITPDIFAAAVQTILTGNFHTIQRWGQPLRAQGSEGVVISYTSASCQRETPAIAHASASKAGVEAMTRTAASEWGRFNLRLNVIAPGLFPFEDTHHASFWEGKGNRVYDRIPLGRAGTMDEIVGPTLYLLSRSARYVTGEIFTVDGGFRLMQWSGARPEDFA